MYCETRRRTVKRLGECRYLEGCIDFKAGQSRVETVSPWRADRELACARRPEDGLQLPELASAGSVWDRLIWPLLSLTWTAPGVDARLGRLQLVVLAARMFEQRAR